MKKKADEVRLAFRLGFWMAASLYNRRTLLSCVVATSEELAWKITTPSATEGGESE